MKERLLPLVPGQQPTHQLAAHLDHLTGNPQPTVDERAKLQLQQLLLPGPTLLPAATGRLRQTQRQPGFQIPGQRVITM